MTDKRTQNVPPPPAPTAAGRNITGELASWLDRCEDAVLHPGSVSDLLVRDGWSRADAGAISESYRSRFDEHRLGYTALLVSTGLTALAAGTLGHLLCSGFDHPISRANVANWMTLLMVSLPFALWAHWWAAAVDRNDPVAVWSRSRRQLGRTLLWAAGVIGVGRLIVYIYELNRTLVGSPGWESHSILGGFLNVLVTVSIALPLWVWAFKFLHRFDDVDPTAPRSLLRREPVAA